MIPLIFSWGRVRVNDRGPAVAKRCPRCNNDVQLRLVTATKWAGLFMIPMVPYNRQHFLLCPICRTGPELGPHELGAIEAAVERGGTVDEIEIEHVAALMDQTQMDRLRETWQPRVLEPVLAAYEQSGIDSSEPASIIDEACRLTVEGCTVEDALLRASLRMPG